MFTQFDFRLLLKATPELMEKENFTLEDILGNEKVITEMQQGYFTMASTFPLKDL
jgi:hypothetical protein